MTDYNSYLDGLMAACRRSVQRPSYLPQYLYVPPQDFTTPSYPPSTTFKEPQSIVPPFGISTAPPATAAADTHNKVPPAATSLGPDVPKNLPPAKTAPRPCVPETLLPPIASPHLDVDNNVPPPAHLQRPAISRDISPPATAPSPFLPLFQLPIGSSASAYASQKANEPMTPTGQIKPRNTTRKGHMKEEPEKLFPARYKNMTQRAMREELKMRGLLCHGPNADLVKRLEQDDEFQAKPRTNDIYDTMDPKDIHRLCVIRFIPSHGTVSDLKVRLKAHDERENRKEHAVPILSPVVVPSGHTSAPEPKASRRMLEEKPLVPTVKDVPVSKTRAKKSVGETLAATKPKKRIEVKPMHSMLHEMLPGNIHKACYHCRQTHRRCIHDRNGDEDPVMAIESAIPRPTAGYIKDKDQVCLREPTPDIEEVAPKCPTRLRLSHPKVSTSQIDEKPSPAIEEFVGTRVTRSHVSDPKATASQIELKLPANTGRVKKDVKRKDKVSNVRRAQLFFQPKDEIILLQICVKLKEVIAWGNISGFWNMVQDTVQLKTGKPFKKVSRHVRILVRKRRAEQQEIEQLGKIFHSRVSAGCRPLLDKWIAGGNREHDVSPNTSNKPTFIEDEDDVSLGKEARQQLDSDDSALEVQKRSATDAWLDTSCDTTRSKKLKLSTSELTPGASTSHSDSIGCWSVSGSSVTSESSLEDESEDVKSGESIESM